MQGHVGLLERIRQSVGCLYVSELRDLTYRRQAARNASKFEGESYQLTEWRDAVAYITGEQIPFDNIEAARAFLARWGEQDKKKADG